MPTSLIYQLLRHGQILLVYPSAFVERPRRVATPREWSLPYEDVELKTSDKVTLRCYLLRPQGAPTETGSASESSETHSVPASADTSRLGTVIMFHGNAMDCGDFLYSANKYYAMKYNVLVVSYRGYGNSDGVPSEKGLRRDAQAALDHLLSDTRTQKPIILSGLSLGGAVAIDLASRNPSKISGLIVENTFTSLPDVVRDWPIIGRVSFLCHQRWKSAAKVPRLPAGLPVLLLSGAADEVVPRKHMAALRDLMRGRGQVKVKGKAGKRDAEKEGSLDEVALANTRFVSFPDGQHGDTFVQRGYWDTVESFLSGICAPVSSPPASGM